MYIFLKMNNYFSRLTVISLILLLSSCVTHRSPAGQILPNTLPEPARSSQALHTSNINIKHPNNPPTKRIEALRSLPILGANLKPKDAASKLDLPKGLLTLNANDLPLNDFVHLALGDVLKLNFTMDNAVSIRRDPVTLDVGKPISAERLLGLVEESLNLFDVAILRGENGLRIVPKATLSTLPPELSEKGNTIHSGQVAALIPLHYVSMNELQGIIGSLFELGKYGRVSFNERLNAVLAIGEVGRVKRLRHFIDFLDRPSFEKRELRLVRPIYWQADDLAKQLVKLLKVQGIPVSDHAEANGSMVVLAMKPINALLVASPQKAWMKLAESFIGKLDAPNARAGIQTFIYFTRHRSAGELGALISATLGSGNSLAKSPVVKQNNNTAPTAISNNTNNNNNNNANSQGTGITAKKGKGLTVVVDEKRSAIIFMGTSSAYEQVVPILERLDIPARQVLIEITVADVNLDNSNQLGVEWQFTNVSNGSPLVGTLGTLGGLGVASAGLSYTLVDSLNNIRAKINALATKGNAKILSSPTLLAMDGERAHMQVGSQISVVTQEVTGINAATGTNGTTNLLRSFQYIDTGVILDIKPTITDYGSIRLNLKQEVSEPGAGVTGQPPIFKRVIDTVMVAESGQTVMLGGLITHNKSDSTTQVPLLGDLPIIGALFRNEKTTDTSTELIILITPHVIRNQSDADFFTKSYRNKLGW